MGSIRYDRFMLIISIENQKGGTAKTTTTVSLAAAFGEEGIRVLVIDMDEQCSATSWLGVEPEGKGSYAILAEGEAAANHVYETDVRGVDLIPATAFLTKLERVVLAHENLALSPNTILKKALKALPENLWDVVLIDCPPALSLATKNALVASNGLIIPVETQYMALQGLQKLVETVDVIREELNPTLEIVGIVGCRYTPNKLLNRDVIAVLKEQFGDKVFTTIVRENVRIAEAPSHRKPITVYDPKCPAAIDYRNLAKEVLQRIGAPLTTAVNA
jgi:chromosome partitioning protein